MVDIKVSKTKTLPDGLIERTLPLLDEIESNILHRAEEVNRLNEVK